MSGWVPVTSAAVAEGVGFSATVAGLLTAGICGPAHADMATATVARLTKIALTRACFTRWGLMMGMLPDHYPSGQALIVRHSAYADSDGGASRVLRRDALHCRLSSLASTLNRRARLICPPKGLQTGRGLHRKDEFSEKNRSESVCVIVVRGELGFGLIIRLEG